MEVKQLIKKKFHNGWKFRKEGDSQWKEITLPHDAMIYEERRADAAGGSAIGFFIGGKYIYEKDFQVPIEWEGKYVAFEFEGVYRKSVVKINGRIAGGCKNGYRKFLVEAGEYIKAGEINTICVEVDNSEMPNSRWYSGSGIYRPVNIFIGDATHIAVDGVKITTLETRPARIQVETICTEGDVTIEILKDEKIVSTGSGNNAIVEISNAKLWDINSPDLYQCKVTLRKSGEIKDEVLENFGIRKITWNTDGFFINGKETLLQGACVHHDNGILGAATYAKSEERRVRILKKQGYNAIRSSHNPASTAMIEACDKYGMYIIDETWDMWYFHKNKYDYATDFMDEYKDDIRSMVERGYNHPSIIMYSLGNEVSEPKEEKGIKLLQEMTNYVHSMDNSRPVTAGINLMVIELASRGKGVYNEEGGRSDQNKQKKKRKKGKSPNEPKSGSLFFNMLTSVIGTNMNRMANSKYADKVTTPALDALDVAGYNYASGRYPLEGKAHPNRVIYGSETFPQDIYKNWKMVKKYPYLVGDFMWTGWDYLGEAGIGTWAYGNADGFDKDYPWLLADVGAINILGYPGAPSYYAATVWGLRDKPYIGVRPVNHPGIRPLKSTWRGTNAFDSWSYRNCEGNKAIIELYSNAPAVQLFLNGKGLGKKRIKQYKAIYKTKYLPGTLIAIAYDAQGREISRSELKSAKGPVNLVVRPEESHIKKGDIVYVPIQIEGENGIVECNADCQVEVMVSGGKLLGFGSANPCTTESYTDGKFSTYYGRALAIVYGTEEGTIQVVAKAENGLYAEATITVTK